MGRGYPAPCLVFYNSRTSYGWTRTTPLQPAYLIYGRTGWIGGELGKLLTAQGADWAWATGRMENRNDVLADISRGVGNSKKKPTHVLVAAGVTGRPNVDWCETNKIQM